MKHKPRTPGRASQLRPRLVTLATVGTVTLGFAGLGIAAISAGPALADPTTQEIAVGSDTIQDVMNQYSVDLTGNLLGSYNAIDPVSGVAGNNISYVRGLNATLPGTTCTETRPNGSGQGQIALRESINPGTTAAPPLPTVAPQGCVDIARSSSGPTSNTGGALAFIPFAEDAVAGSVGPAAAGTIQGINGPVNAVATVITQAGLFTKTDLINLYTNCQPVTEGGVQYWPQGSSVTQPPGSTVIDLYVPQPGSGTRNFWAGQLGFNNTTLPTCVHDHIIAGADNGNAVEEHNGIAVSTDPNGYGPFSIAQWISQSKHCHGEPQCTATSPIDIDRRYGATLQDINGAAPFNGSVPNESMNAAFPINREVYNVVEACRVDSTAPLPFTGATCSLDNNLIAMLSGGGSSLCQDALTIINYGFALLPNANEPDSCGAVTPALRSQLPPV
jgi:hypothetical protein